MAWGQELRRVHQRLRRALQVARQEAADGDAGSASRELLLYCHGFCAALDGHHRGEDVLLFPAIAEAYPDLGPTLRRLEQDHSMIGHLLGSLQAAIARSADSAELGRHLEGVAAIMESHFRYEERALAVVLEGLDLSADPTDVFGPL